jgi:hypothetical protein
LSRVLLSSLSCGGVLLTATIAAAQTPHSGRTTSAVEQLGLDDTPAAPTTAGQLRELVCLGKAGIDLRVDREPSPRDPKLVAMVLHYERPKRVTSLSYEGMGTVDNGVSLQYLPGTCGWGGGLYPGIPLEPQIVYFDLPRDGQSWVPVGQRDTTIDAAVNYPDVASLIRYLNDPERRWIFYVDDATNISISFRAWPLSGGVVASAANGGATSTSHSLTTSRGQQTSDAGTRTVITADGSVAGSRQDAMPDRAASEPSAAEQSISKTPAPGAPVGAVDSSRNTDKSSTSRTSPATPGSGRRKDARTESQVSLARGIWDVTVGPGPAGARLLFHAQHGGGVRVQFSKNPPRWDDSERHWAYPSGLGGPWFAELHRPFIGTTYEAVPRFTLEVGARYHYLITVLADADSPMRQRTGVFTAAMTQSK